MAASHEWQEYHPTPNGWVVGNAKWDFQKADPATLTGRAELSLGVPPC